MNLLLMILLTVASAAGLPRECSAADALTVRNGQAMAYDRDHRVVLLFGGADERQVLSNLWAWDGQEWRCLSEGGPTPRTFPGLAYDSVRKQLILFGGNRVLFGTDENTNTFLDDMWVWDGRGWFKFRGATPPARAEAGMVFDRNRQRIVLFGGHRTIGGKRLRSSDTWEWDGQQWEQKSSDGPPARNGAAMAFDSHRNRVVLFGGSGATGDTWEWDGQQWERISSEETQGRFNSVMAFDEANRVVIRFGGWTGSSRVGDTWQYDGTQWTKVTEEGPVGRNHASMAYDPHRNVIVMFGGHDGDRVFGDTWELSGGTWTLRSDETPRLRVNNGH